MDYQIDKECSALGGLFQTIINDMKTQAPIWEDFINKASKLHSTLRTTIVAIGAFLETFQKVADMATNTRGATREIGSALTRLCMRHRSIEQKLKVFTSSILDLCVNPLQERMEEWKRTVIQLDKDHAKEYKKARNEIKKASSDTMRLQKKARKGKNDVQNRLDSALQEVTEKFMLLEETEKNAVRTALIEERNRFCLFISCLKPVVDEEIAMLTEITHLQEVIDALCMQAGDPTNLPPASEQVILDLRASDSHAWSFQVSKTPPSSPSSIGSRKSSMCSISSIASSSSGSTKSHSPSHHLRHRASSQILEVQLSAKPPLPGTVRLSSVSSQDSGFTSQDTLFLKNPTPPPLELDAKMSIVRGAGHVTAALTINLSGRPTSSNYIYISQNSQHEANSGVNSGSDSNASTPSPSHYAGPPSTSASTWSNWPDPPHHQAKPDPSGLPFDRPHTISSAYERHARPLLTAQTFEPPEQQQQQQQQQQNQQQQQQNQGAQHQQHRATDRPTSAKTAPSTPSPYAVPTLYERPALEQQSSEPGLASAAAAAAAASPYAVPCIVPQTRRDSKVGGTATSAEGGGSGSPHRAQPPPTGPKPRVRPVAPPIVPDFNSVQPDQSKKKNVYVSTAIPQPVYVNMNELATLAVAKQKEVEEHRRQQQQQQQKPDDPGGPPGGAGEGGGGGGDESGNNKAGMPAPVGDPSPYARPSFARCQRSVSMPAQDVHPLSKAIEELNQRTAALRSPHRAASPRRQVSAGPAVGAETKNQEGRELADAIKELEASTAALQLVYDGAPSGGPPGGRPGARHSVAITGYSPHTQVDYDGDDNVLPPYPSAPSYHGNGGHQKGVAVMRSQSFRLPPTPRRPTFTGHPAGPGSASTLRRGSLPAKPPAPVRRTSSISAGMSGMYASSMPPGPPPSTTGGGDQRERSGSKTPTPQGTPTRHRRTTSDMTSVPPDRPPDVSGGGGGGARHSFAGHPPLMDSDNDDDDDDGAWPPPPPADFMTPPPTSRPTSSVASTTSTAAAAATAVSDTEETPPPGRRSARGSVCDSHAEVMQNLNAVFSSQSLPAPPAGAQMWHPDSLPLDSGVGCRHERALSQSSDDVTPTAEAPPMSEDNLLVQIKRGVSLRRAQSNDRSAPRLPQR